MKPESQARSTWRSDLLPLAVIVLLSAVYFFSFFNRFAGLRSGDGEFGGGIAFLAGLRPYRDYFTAGPPLNVFKSALVLTLFGKLLIVSRTLAVFERLLLACVLFRWLRKYFTQQASIVGAFVAIVVSAGDHTDPLASYNHDAILLAILCGYIACCSLDRGRRSSLLCSLSGAAGGLALLTKQTVGAFALFSVCLCGCLAVAKMDSWRRALRWVASFIAGAVTPVLLVVAYLWRLGALSACLDMMFISGPKAKASHTFVFLAREVMIAGLYRWWLLLAVILLLASGRVLGRGVASSSNRQPSSTAFWVRTSVVSVVLLALTLWAAGKGQNPLQDSGKTAVYFVLLGTAYIGLLGVQRAFQSEGEEQRRTFQIAVFSALSLAIALSLSLSFPAFEAMVLPGLGLLLAAAFDGAPNKGKMVVVAVSALAVLLQVREKMALPFGFDHQMEGPVSIATQRSSDPMLKGMRLPSPTISFLDDVKATIAERAGADGRLFTYPEFGLLYSLSGRYPPTRTTSHNMDVVNDSFAQAEALRLLESPPAVIVYAKPTAEDIRIAELVWREGHPSGQRSIIAAVEQIIQGYDLIGTYRLLPEDTPIRIYARHLPGTPTAGASTQQQ